MHKTPREGEAKTFVNIKNFNHTWDHLADFMKAKGEKYYSREVGDAFLDACHDGKSYKQLTVRQKERVRHVTVLTDILLYGVVRRSRYVNIVYSFDGSLGFPFREFISKEKKVLKQSSIRLYERCLDFLYKFLQSEGKELKDFSFELAHRFLIRMESEKTPFSRDNIVMTTRVFVRFLCEQNILPDNRQEMWNSILKLKHNSNNKIPTVYTAEEVERLIAAIDRCSPQGKRDYAMILLAARYGLRASDIMGLRFCNLCWEQNKIVVVQQKTGKKVSLPLSEEVGGAIVEYIKYARPDIDNPFVFLTVRAPYKELSGSIISRNVAHWISVAGINCVGKKKGSHALRHSLASNLLALNTPLPVISEILGHNNSESTKTYTRVSINMLRQCALDVPLVSSIFYGKAYE